MVNSTKLAMVHFVRLYLSETDSVGLTAEILTLGKVKALNVAKHPRVILETVGRGSNIISKILMFLEYFCIDSLCLTVTSTGHCSLSG